MRVLKYQSLVLLIALFLIAGQVKATTATPNLPLSRIKGTFADDCCDLKNDPTCTKSCFTKGNVLTCGFCPISSLGETNAARIDPTTCTNMSVKGCPFTGKLICTDKAETECSPPKKESLHR